MLLIMINSRLFCVRVHTFESTTDNVNRNYLTYIFSYHFWCSDSQTRRIEVATTMQFLLSAVVHHCPADSKTAASLCDFRIKAGSFGRFSFRCRILITIYPLSLFCTALWKIIVITKPSPSLHLPPSLLWKSDLESA